jgi:cellulase/cellobiase CelA1
MKRLRLWSFTALVALAAGCAASGEESPTAGSDQSITANGADVTLRITNDWGGGYCSDVQIVNQGAATITGWTVIVSLGNSTFGNAWNAVTSVSGGTLTATPMGYNTSIAPGLMISHICDHA